MPRYPPFFGRFIRSRERAPVRRPFYLTTGTIEDWPGHAVSPEYAENRLLFTGFSPRRHRLPAGERIMGEFPAGGGLGVTDDAEVCQGLELGDECSIAPPVAFICYT